MTQFDELSEAERSLATSLQARLRATETLDYVTSAKLGAARARALAQAGRPQRSWLYATGGLTAAAIVAMLLVIRGPHVHTPAGIDTGAGAQSEALDVLTDDVDTDFYEDLDLYRWLDKARDDDV